MPPHPDDVRVRLTDYERLTILSFLAGIKPETTPGGVAWDTLVMIYSIQIAIGRLEEKNHTPWDSPSRETIFPMRDAKWLRDRVKESRAHTGALAMGLIPAVEKLTEAIAVQDPPKSA